jgi:hypothetical protein
VVSQAIPRTATASFPSQARRQSRNADSSSDGARKPEADFDLERVRHAANRVSARALSASMRAVCSAPISAKRTSTSLREMPSSLPRRSASLASSSGSRSVVRGPRCFGARALAPGICLAMTEMITHQPDAHRTERRQSTTCCTSAKDNFRRREVGALLLGQAGDPFFRQAVVGSLIRMFD